MTCYGSNMTNRRTAHQGLTASPKAAGCREADALASSMKDAPVRELLVAGGFRGFTVEDLFSKGAA